MAPKSKSAEEIAALFQLPLKEFTGARDALATRLKKAGAGAEAAEVKALAKPTLSAWVVNQLYWRERERFDELLSAVADLRAAQRARGDLRAPLEVRRQALAALTRAASGRLREVGGNPTPELMRRVAGTLEALATLGGAPGQLSRDLDPPGFEALAGFPRAAAPPGQAGGKDSRVLPFARPGAKSERRGGAEANRESERQAAQERSAARTAARRALQESEADLRAAQAAAKRAAADVTAALQRQQAALAEKEKLERLLDAAATAAKDHATEVRKLERDSKSAAEAVDAAERRLQKARQALDE